MPPVAPRPGHTALVLAAGIADGAVIASDEHGLVALRGKTRPVEVISRVDIEPDERDPRSLQADARDELTRREAREFGDAYRGDG